jgi:hypothetical protein
LFLKRNYSDQLEEEEHEISQEEEELFETLAYIETMFTDYRNRYDIALLT